MSRWLSPFPVFHGWVAGSVLNLSLVAFCNRLVAKPLFIRLLQLIGRKTSLWPHSTTGWSKNLYLVAFYNRLTTKPLLSRLPRRAGCKTSLWLSSTTGWCQTFSLIFYNTLIAQPLLVAFYNRLVTKPLFGNLLRHAGRKISLWSPSATG